LGLAGIVNVYTASVEVEGLGKARINFALDSGFETDQAVEMPIEQVIPVPLILKSGALDVKKLPVSLNVEVYDAPSEVLDQTSCAMVVGNNRYEGVGFRDVVLTDKKSGTYADGACFYDWRKPGE